MANHIQTRPPLLKGRPILRLLIFGTFTLSLVSVSLVSFHVFASDAEPLSVDLSRISETASSLGTMLAASLPFQQHPSKFKTGVKTADSDSAGDSPNSAKSQASQPTEPGVRRQGAGATQLKALDEASAALAVQIAKYPDDPSLHNRIAMIYSGIGDFPMATSHFQQAVSLCRNQLAALRAEEAKLRAQGEDQQACEKVLLASKVSVELEAAHSFLARVYDQVGQHDKVVAELDALNRDLAFGTESPARVNGVDADTQTAAQPAVNTTPIDADQHQLNEKTMRLLARAQALMQARRLPEAEQTFKQASLLDPQAAMPHEQLGRIYLQCNNYGMAIDELEKARSLDSDSGTVYSDLGLAYQSSGDVDHAIAMFGKALTLKPKDANTAFNLGTLLAAQGKFQEAQDAFQKAVENNPRMAQAHDRLGTILSLNGNYKEAAQEFRQALMIGPETAAAHYGLGVALYRLKNYPACIPELKRALALNPSLIDAHNKIDHAFRKAGLAQGPAALN